MKRIRKCLDFEMKYMGRSTLIFLGIYFGIYLILAAAIFISRLYLNSGSNINTGFYMVGSIFIFAFVASSYKPLFNYLMMFGNTRKSIILSSFITFAALSAAMAVITIAALFLDSALLTVSGSGDSDLIKVIYQGGISAAAEFLWFLAFFLFVGSLAMLYGSMIYKFGKGFILAFWIAAFSLLILGPINTGSSNLFRFFFRLDSANGILLAPVNFILTAVIFGAITYFTARRQSQEA